MKLAFSGYLDMIAINNGARRAGPWTCRRLMFPMRFEVMSEL